MTVSSNCGLFGKVPQQAEYINHFLDKQTTELWHQWLQASLSVSREQLGDEWLDYYLTSPIWHFALSPGLISDRCVVGVMMPSVDQVGRYFPVTLMHAAEHQPWAAYLYGEAWFHEAESVLLNALDEDMTYNHWIGQVESLDVPAFQALANYTYENANASTKAGLVTNQNGLGHGGLMQALMAGFTERAFGPFGLWWSSGSEHIEPCLAISPQLPDAGQFSALLDGRWQHWGWPMNVPKEGGQ